MSIKSVIKMGNQALLNPSLPVTDFHANALKEMIIHMQDTMQAKGGVGIAAPQINCNLRVIMFGFEKSERYPGKDSIPFTVLINPTITFLSEETTDDWEGCLSIPGLRGLVPRYKKIKYDGYDIHGNFIMRIAEDFHARVVQHEYDHLDGILFPQRMKDMRSFSYEDELVKMNN